METIKDVWVTVDEDGSISLHSDEPRQRVWQGGVFWQSNSKVRVMEWFLGGKELTGAKDKAMHFQLVQEDVPCFDEQRTPMTTEEYGALLREHGDRVRINAFLSVLDQILDEGDGDVARLIEVVRLMRAEESPEGENKQ